MVVQAPLAAIPRSICGTWSSTVLGCHPCGSHTKMKRMDQGDMLAIAIKTFNVTQKIIKTERVRDHEDCSIARFGPLLVCLKQSVEDVLDRHDSPEFVITHFLPS